MKYVQVYIGEELIDLVPKQGVAMSYQLNDIGDVKNQLANFSNVFKAARTKDNDRKLGFASDVNSADRRPYRQLPARIIVDGEDVVPNGYATIQKTDKHYNIVVYSGLLDLYAKLGDKSISDLNMVEYDHRFNSANIAPLVDATEGICYPLIDYGQYGISTPLMDYMRFSTYAKVIYEKILTDAGFEFSGSFFTHPHYAKLLVPFTNEKMTSKQDAIDGSFKAEITEGFDTPTNPNTWVGVTGWVVTSGNAGGHFNTNGYTVGNFNKRGKFTADLKVRDTWGGTQWLAVQLWSSTRGVLAFSKVNNPGAEVTLKLAHELTDFVEGEFISVRVKHERTDTITVKGTFSFVQDTVVPYDGWLPVAENLPPIKQKDFMKSIAQIYGLVYDIDLQTNQLRARFMDELVDNRPSALDWSGKLDLSKQDEITYRLDGVAKENVFTYANGTTEEDDPSADAAASGQVPYGYGSASVFADDDNLAAKKDATQLVFAATEERDNADLLSFDQTIRLPYIKIFTPTVLLTELTLGPSGEVTNVPPWIYTNTFYASPPVYDGATTYYTGKRVKYAGIVWEFQSDVAASGKVPGTHFDAGDDGTNYTGKPYWLPANMEVALLYKQTVKVKPRLLLAVPGTIGVAFQTEQIPAEVPTGPPITPIFLGALDFATRVPANYKVFTDAVQNTKRLRAYFTLTAADVKLLDFLRPIYVGKYSSFFYLRMIDKYQQGQSTPVDLVKI